MKTFKKQVQERRFKSKKPTIAWIFTDWTVSKYREENNLYGGIGYYRVILPSRHLTEFYDIDVIGADIRTWGTEDETYTRLGRDYDLIITRHMMDARTASNILAVAKHFNRKVLVDIDDNYMQMRADNPALKDYDIGTAGRGVTGALLELADGIITSTKPLQDVYLKLNKNVHVLPNCNDISEWPYVQKEEGIKIGFAGGRGHNADLELILEPIAKILEKYPTATFEVLGALEPEKAREFGSKMLKFAPSEVLNRFRIAGGTASWKGYPELLSEQKWDIGLCPLINDDFNRGKSHIKWLEYSSVGMATVASPVYPFIEPIDGVKVIEHGKTGLLAKNSEEWFDCLELLIRNPDIRKQIASNAYNFVKDNWQQAQWANKWKQVIDKYL